ncbi:MAG: oxidoreductase [Moraxellaceae bacterium]|jgi:hypothetical protein|nr:MAG: oxidoreductase [Moraxellaceae bacterium]
MNSEFLDKRIYDGLKALAANAFPKWCAQCGAVYTSAEDFFTKTQPHNCKSGLVEATDEEGYTVVGLYRACSCGHELTGFFDDRRDWSETGLKRRQKFGALLDYVVERGVERSVARQELLKVLRGYSSDILRKITPPKI